VKHVLISLFLEILLCNVLFVKQTLSKQGSFLRGSTKESLDPEYKKDMNVRPYILEIYNKRREDFKDLRSYNDYLEEVEDIIYNLSNDIDRTITEQKIKKYREQNQEVIILNQSKRVEYL